jgi:adenylosuccinate lyase
LHFDLLYAQGITDLVKNLLVYPEHMKRNMNVYGGVIFSQRVLLTLVSKGISLEPAYKIVQENAHRAWNTNNAILKL